MTELSEFGEVRLIDHMGDDLSVIRAARVSYGKAPGEEFDEEKDGRLLRYLLKHGHWSPFEHATVTFGVRLPIFVARQWMRHYSWSFNEISGRYKELPTEFYVPRDWRGQSTTNKQGSGEPLGALNQLSADYAYQYALDDVVSAYQTLLNLGVAREQARAILPVSTYTEFYATANLRNILHFLSSRTAPDAQQEIREYAEKVDEIVYQLFPHTIEAWDEVRGVSGKPSGYAGSTPATSTKEFQDPLFPANA